MSTFKKVISIVLCIAMLAGTFTMLGGLVTPEASAAEGTSKIKSYEDLAAQYDDFIYLGTEVYEIETADGTLAGAVTDRILTDYYVDAGQLLEFKLYVKSDMYAGNSTIVIRYDNAFFDVTQTTSAAPNKDGYTNGLAGVTNPAHPTVDHNKIKYNAMSSACSSASWIVNMSGYAATDIAKWDFTQAGITYDSSAPNDAYEFTSDEWFISWYAKVKDTVAENATGTTDTKYGFWKCDDNTAEKVVANWNRRNANIPYKPKSEASSAIVSDTASMYTNYGKMKAFLIDDLSHTFTCAKNPADSAGTGPIEGTSKIKSYDELAEQYDDFIYLGTEVYEIETADGTLAGAVTDRILTDYYVDAGQLLEFKLYVKSDMYAGNSTIVIRYDNAFFDVTQTTSAAPNKDGYTNGLAGVTNPAHPTVDHNKIKYNAMSSACSSASWIVNMSGYAATDIAKWDFTQAGITYDSSAPNDAYEFTSDEWFISWYAKVKDTVAENATGTTDTKYGFWKCDDNTAEKVVANWNRRNANIPYKPKSEASSAIVSDTASMYTNYGKMKAFLIDDLSHTFTCGKNPNAGVVRKYTVNFVEWDDEIISTADYVKDAPVAIPAAVENQVGWADASGKLVDLEGYKASTNATFKRVLSTDEIEIKIDLKDGTIGSELPENARIEDGKLIITANINDVIDMSELPLPEKEGYTGAWNDEEITVDSIKGKTSAITWTANTYKASFYANKGDTEAIAVSDVAYNSNVACKDVVVPEGKKFAGWADAETDAIVSNPQSLQTIRYTFAEDKSFYATFTDYDSSFTFMVRDYANGTGWKVGAVKYADKGTSFKTKDINAALASIAADQGATVACLSGTTVPLLYSDEAVSKFVSIADGLTYDGAQVIYVATTLDFNITWKVPAYTEDGELTGEYNEVKAVASTNATGTDTMVFSVYAKTTADTTPPQGYVFKGWINERTNEAIDYKEGSGVKLDDSFARELIFVADFQEAEFTLKFNMNNGGSPDILTLDKTFKKGDKLSLDGAKAINAEGKEVVLPVIGLENSEQANPFINRYGYEFAGWIAGYGTANEAEFTFPVEELTADIIATYASGETITVYADWEALEYAVRFFYASPETDLSKPLTADLYTKFIPVNYKTGETINTKLTGENLALIEQNTPEGYQFLNFKKLEEGTIGKMPAYGLDVYATYIKNSINVYVDYNNGKLGTDGKPLPLKDTLALSPILTQNPVFYGDDLEREADLEAGIKSGVGSLIKRSLIDEANRPGENYEVVGWKVYHVPAGKDIYDNTNWVEGENDEGTTIARTTVIYQPEWKHHREFIFRVYGTDAKIYMALGKNLKLYYWTNNYPCSRKDTQLNKDPENLVVLLLIPEFENWDWDRFFDISMWQNVTLRYDPIFAPKSMFTLEAFMGLMGALRNLIKSLL